MCDCNKPQLGDKIEKALGTVGLKSCAECKQRKNEFNIVSRTFGRRGFVAGMIAIPFAVKNMAILAAQSLTSATPALEEWAVLGFIRTFNNVQIKSLVNDGVSLEGADAFIQIAGHKEHFDPKKSGYRWMSVFTPGGKQVLPGWQHAHKQPSGSEYLLAMVGPTYTFLTDESGLLYRAPAGTTDLTGIDKAGDYPGSISMSDVNGLNGGQLSTWQKIKREFTTVTYANGPDPIPCPNCPNQSCCNGSSCYTQCGAKGSSTCSGCVASCPQCSTSGCKVSRPYAGCFFNVGCLPCPWYISGEPSGCYSCQTCADVFATCCACLGPNCQN